MHCFAAGQRCIASAACPAGWSGILLLCCIHNLVFSPTPAHCSEAYRVGMLHLVLTPWLLCAAAGVPLHAVPDGGQ
jgi:hypothetical protein